MPDLILERASEKNIAVLVKFAQEMSKERTGIELAKEATEAGIRQMLCDVRLGEYWLAVYRNVEAGQVLFTLEWNDWRNGWKLWIRRLYVAPEFRRLGIANGLVEHARMRANEIGNVVEIMAGTHQHNAPPQRALAHIGAVPIGLLLSADP